MYARVLAEYYPPRRRANPTIVLFKPQEDRPFLDMHGGGEQREDNPAASSSSAHAPGSTRDVHNVPPVLPVGAGRPVTIVDTDNQVPALSSSVARVAAQPADFESTEAAADPHGSRVASAQAETGSYNVVYPPPRHPSGTVYHVLGQIGRGGFSRVMVAASSAGELVALKIMHKPTVLRLPNMRENVKMERDIMAMVIDRRKQFLLPLKAAWEQGDHIYFAMELCPQDLRLRIRSGFISRREKQLLCMEMILALIDLQKLEVIHGDIKPDNFLITKTGRVVLSDFGLAQRPTRLNRCCGTTGLYDFADWSASETYGTPGYVALEGLCRRSAHYTGGLAFTSRADVFSLGLVFVELFCGLDKPIWLMPNLAPEHPDMDTQTWEEMDEFEQQVYLMMTEGLSRIHTGDLWMDNPAKRMVTQRTS
ncbi:hypothetical protein BN946_scf184940.g95 [Trametes cinnabarina]|uniref:non-specific serine/threonine protein kinase n=1 Tax=Pycnoporus cinnabarinus TaxID=5643 RepID=A0A060SHP6_PYCCI|nr:hypothetical protein BN946_scf184940.g95 [Trametes cinnabarina]